MFIGFVTVFLCLMVFLMPAYASASSQTPSSFTGSLFGLIIIGICVSKRQKEIGGFLLYFYIQIYLSLIATAIISMFSYKNYLPGEWAAAPELYPIFLVSTVPGLLIIVIQFVVAEKLRKSRDFAYVRVLRYVFWADLVLAIVATLIDIRYFEDNIIFDILLLIWPMIWLPYFYFSKRVKRVFDTKNWIPVKSDPAVA